MTCLYSQCTDGCNWLAAGFSSDFLKAALPGFVSCTQNLVELLGRKADQQEVVQMHLVAILTTLEIITKVEYWDTDQGEHNAGKRQAAARTGDSKNCFAGCGPSRLDDRQKQARLQGSTGTHANRKSVQRPGGMRAHKTAKPRTHSRATGTCRHA